MNILDHAFVFILSSGWPVSVRLRSPSLRFIFIIWWLPTCWCIFNCQASILTVSQFSGGDASWRAAAACWPWTLEPNLWISARASETPSSLIFPFNPTRPTFWRTRQLAVPLRWCPLADLKAWLTLKGGFRVGIPSYWLLCVWSGLAKGVRVWLIEPAPLPDSDLTGPHPLILSLHPSDRIFFCWFLTLLRISLP